MKNNLEHDVFTRNDQDYKQDLEKTLPVVPLVGVKAIYMITTIQFECYRRQQELKLTSAEIQIWTNLHSL
ncbi:hypothetical protein I4U23_027797 [Adineta vaga]|nr:hypothetical protein I4U23_027797 [Adineta vaga]